ncbi:hypothetical protein SBF1_4860007 [Candidatus Desulfosporosinus infrequens]|uniref:Uncharacterized protein n=1 Tax=Candidatus Desulfosporosinus infrequens TaxID=2043169 RepID=A0A2U3LFK4_9FIRM|nr:hypothetical protein SBF1_4860007 [Candidatus Desulfosporosinus infrequens]
MPDFLKQRSPLNTSLKFIGVIHARKNNNYAFLPVNDGFQHKTYSNIFGVGTVAELPVSFKTPVQNRVCSERIG